MKLHETRWVELGKSEAFDFTADFANIEDWDPGVVSSKKIGDGTVDVGTKFEVEVKFGLGTEPMVYEITEYEPHDRVVLVGVGDKLEAIDEIKFSTHDKMTLIDYTAELTFQGLMGWVAPLISPVLKNVGIKALDGLVEALDRLLTPSDS